MMKLKRILNIDRRWWVCLLAFVIIITCAVIGFYAGSNKNLKYDTTVTDLDAGWISEDGRSLTLSNLPHGEITVAHSLEGIDLQNKRLCMKSVDTVFEVYADGSRIYTYDPELPAFLGVSYGMYIHAIPLPEDTQIVELRLTPIFPEAPPAALNTTIQDAGMFMGDLFLEGMPGFCLCILMLVLGVIMVTIAFFTAGKDHQQQIEFLTLGFFALIVAVWSVNDTLVVQTLTQNPAMVRLTNYISLIFLPYFPVSFIASATGNRNTRLLPVLFLLICLNFILNLSLTCLQIADYYDLLKLSHAVIVVALCMMFYLIVSAVRKHKVAKNFMRSFLAGTVMLSIGGIIDLVRYRASSNVIQGTSGYTRMGALMFLLMIGLHLIRENNRIQVENSRALERLAYTDGLTGLKNRLAFHEREAELQKSPDTSCMIIQFDINNLKKVNDEFGHAEGDRHISGAASIIRDSIHNAGDCYRTGGDEFIAILPETEDEIAVKNTIEHMEQLVDAYNIHEKPPVLLEIAYGMASFKASEGGLDKAERLADQRMYECKKRKKENSSGQ